MATTLSSTRALENPQQEMVCGQWPTVRTFRSIAELDEIKDVWSSWHRHPNASFDLFLMQVRRRKNARPHVIAVCRDGIPDCILAGWLWSGPQTVNVGGTTVAISSARSLFFIRAGYLGNETTENSELLVRQILQSLEAGEADLAELSHVPVTSSLYSAARHFPEWLGRDHYCSRTTHCRLTLPHTFDSFLAALPRKTRHNYRTYARRMNADFGGNIEVRCFQNGEQLDYVLSTAENITSKTFKRKMGVGFVNDASAREELALSAKAGRLRSYILYLAGEPCAFLIGKHDMDIFCAHSASYDPKYKRYAPGFLVMMYCIRDLIESRALCTYDFGLGDQRYNHSIATEKWHEATICIYRPRAKGLAVKLLRTSIIMAHHLTEKVLSRTALRDDFVRAWRRMLMKWNP